jgi:DNA-binding transcriptional LysR family regulator
MPGDTRGRFVNDLDWNLLRTFVVIVEQRGITAAANKLLLRQPTVSLALQRLEAQMGTRLVERGRGVFRLTAAGQELYRESADIYGSITQLQEVVGSASREVTGTVRIALASHVITPLLDDTLAAFHATHPKATYEIRIATSADVARRVQDKSVSFGVCLVNRSLPQLQYEIIYREFFGFFCGPSHPLFGRNAIRIEDLRGLSAVSFDTDDLADALRPVALLRHRHELDQTIIGHSSHLEEVRRMIMCGLGIGPLPIHVVERDVRDGLLWRLPPYDDPPAIDIFLVTHPRKRLNSAEQVFLATLRASIAATPLSQRTYAGPSFAPDDARATR